VEFQAAVRPHIEHFLIEWWLPTPVVSYPQLVRELLAGPEAGPVAAG
jgi:hypothetical protein